MLFVNHFLHFCSVECGNQPVEIDIALLLLSMGNAAVSLYICGFVNKENKNRDYSQCCKKEAGVSCRWVVYFA
jgi:hypothetical protein